MGVNSLSLGIIGNRKLIRKSLLCLLLTLPLSSRISVVIDADSVDDASQEITDSNPDVILLDCNGADDCFGSVRKLRKLSPSTKSLLLADKVGEAFAIEAVRSGAWGLVGTEADPALFEQAICKVAGGEMWFSQGTMSMAIQAFTNHEQPRYSLLDRLAPREMEVLALLAKGFHNKQIASRLFLSESTVKTYIKAIYRKLNVSSRVEAVIAYNDNVADAALVRADSQQGSFGKEQIQIAVVESRWLPPERIS